MPQAPVLHTCSLCGVVAPECDEYRMPKGWLIKTYGEYPCADRYAVGGPPLKLENYMRLEVCTEHRDELDRETALKHLAYLKAQAWDIGYILIRRNIVSAADLSDEAMNAERAARQQFDTKEADHA